jgi:hypothetical protein
VNAAGTAINWTLGTPPSGLNGAGIIGTTVGGGANSPGPNPNNSLNDGETVTFMFTLTGNYNLSNVQFALHDQGGSGQYSCANSTKLVVSQTGTGSNAWDANATPADCLPPTTTAPEPASMFLLATGLLGMAGIQLRRRRDSAKS